MAKLLHGYIQLAKRTAEQSGYEIRKGTKGWNVWRMSPRCGWQAIAMFGAIEDAEDYVFGQIAVMGD